MTTKNRTKFYAFLLIVLLYGLFACTNNSDKEIIHILKPGIGFDDIELDKLTINEIKTKYGDNYSTDTFYVNPIICPSSLDPDSSVKREIFSFRLFYASLGISFYYKPDQNKFTAIRVEAPFKAKTDKGIVLNESTFKEIIKTYGDTSWAFVADNIIREYNGVCFFQPFKDTLPTTDSFLKKYLDKKVTEISIYKFKKH